MEAKRDLLRSPNARGRGEDTLAGGWNEKAVEDGWGRPGVDEPPFPNEDDWARVCVGRRDAFWAGEVEGAMNARWMASWDEDVRST